MIVDGASTDSTPDVVRGLSERHPELRYFREPVNSGVDQDYDRCVGYATGDYCWLMTDDDLLRPGAVDLVLACLVADEPDLLVVEAEVRDADLDQVLGTRLQHLPPNKSYGDGRAADVFRDLGSHLSFIGCVVIRRSLWLSRDRASYYGSLFIHVGVVFQQPPLERVSVITSPLVTIRYGNAMWLPRWFEIWSFKWPNLIWSFPGFSDADKSAVIAREPWRRAKTLTLWRATGGYTRAEYRRFLLGRVSGLARLKALAIALMPGKLANALAGIYLGLFRPEARVEMYDLLAGPHATGIARLATRYSRR